MAEITGISWTDSTANFWIGCTKVSPACDHCYAERDWDHRYGRVTWGAEGHRSYVKGGWKDLAKWQRNAETNPGHVDPKLERRRRVFINSLSDIGDNHPSITWHGEAFALLQKCDLLTLQIVTKRPKMLRKLVERHVPHWLEPGGWPAHIWVLVTVEDQDRADERRESLRAIPAPIRGVSYEPALGPVDWSQWDFINWLISGGESGPKARPSHPDWFRAARDWCDFAGVAYLHKQNGEWHTDEGPIETKTGIVDPILNSKASVSVWDGDSWEHWHDGYCPPLVDGQRYSDWLYRIGTKRSGHLLDGKEHKEFPA